MNTTIESVIVQKYVLLDKLGSGKFGTVYRGLYKKTGEPVAIKMEDSRTDHKILKHETKILKYLYEHGSRQIPIIYWYGLHKQNTCLVMSFFELSLYDYSTSESFDSTKIDIIMLGCIQIIESIHKYFVIHRDIKPQNFMISSGAVYIIDFGLATFYIDENGNHVIDQGSQDNIIGTPKYVSYHIHDGKRPSRRDDLISLGYMYIFLHCRELHWDSLKSAIVGDPYNDIHILNEKNVQRKELKQWENVKTTCVNINDKLFRYLEYCYQLNYDELPNYKALMQLFVKTI